MASSANELDLHLAASIRDVLERPVGGQGAGGASGRWAALLVLGVLSEVAGRPALFDLRRIEAGGW